MDVFEASAAEGFRPSDYLTPDLDLAAAGTDPLKLAAVETAFSGSALRYAQHVYGGRIAPTTVSSLWTVTPKPINGTEMLMKLASAEDPAAVLADLEPKHKEFLLLKQALANFNDGLVEQQLSVPEGEVLKPGMDDARVPLLRQRLNVAEPEIAESATTAPGPEPHLRRSAGRGGEDLPGKPRPDRSTASSGPQPSPPSTAAPRRPRKTSSPTWNAGAGCPRTSATSTST